MINNILLFITIGVCLAVFAKNYILQKGKAYDTKIIMFTIPDKIFGIISIFSFLVFFISRAYKLGEIPFGVNQDEAMAAVDAIALMNYQTDRFGTYMPVHLTAWGYGQMSPMLSYLMVPFFRLFGVSRLSVALPVFVTSIIGGVFTFFLVKKCFGNVVAVVFAWFLAINPWHFMQSRWSIDCQLFPEFFVIALYFLILSTEKKCKRLLLILSMVFFGLSMYCYGISLYTVPPFLILAAIYLIVTRKVSVADIILSVCVYLAVSWAFFAVMAVNFLELDTIVTPFFTIPRFSSTIRQNDIIFFSDKPLSQLLANIKSFLKIVVFQRKDIPCVYIDGFGTMYLFSMPFAFLGGLSLFKKVNREKNSWLFIIWIIISAVSGLITRDVDIGRINLIFYPIIISCALGIYEVMSAFSGKIAVGIVSLVYSLAFVVFLKCYFIDYPFVIDVANYCDFEKAVRATDEFECDNLYITSDTQYTGSTAVSEILTLYYLQIDAEYFQGKKEINGWLPYSERFIYFTESNAYVPRDGIYVVRDATPFDDTYEKYCYGQYYLVVPQSEVEK